VVVAAEGDDPFSLKNSDKWVPISGSNGSTSDPIVFFTAATGIVYKLSAMWEVGEIFSAGLAFRSIQWNMEEEHRTSDMQSLGVQFRINFASNTKKVVPYFQGAYYFSNSNYMEQAQATGSSPDKTQPAFSTSQKTSLGFDADFGLEVKVSNNLGLQFTLGFMGTQATEPGYELDLDYGAYQGPSNLDGVFNYSLSTGLKYYVGRGAKKRDF